MSNQKATGGFHRDEQFSTLVLMSGRDCAPGKFLSQQSPDLWVKGGSLIEKTLCVGGNIGVEGFLIGNVCSELVLASQIQEKFFGEGIIASGNIMMQPDDNLYVSSIRSNPGRDLCLSAPANQSVSICSGNCLDLNGRDICNAGNIDADNLELGELNLMCGNIHNVDTLTISRLEGSNCNGTEVSIVSDAFLERDAQVGGNLLVNSDLLVAGDLCAFGESFLKANASVIGGLDVGTDLCVFGESELKANAVVSMDLEVGQSIQLTNTNGNSKIMFSDGIVIGDMLSGAASATSVVVGKSASATGDESIAIGLGASVSGNSAVAIGLDATVEVDDTVAIGTNATTGNVGNAIAIGHDAGVINLDSAHPLALGLTSGVTTEAIASTHTLGVVIGGVQYKILLSNL